MLCTSADWVQPVPRTIADLRPLSEHECAREAVDWPVGIDPSNQEFQRQLKKLPRHQCYIRQILSMHDNEAFTVSTDYSFRGDCDKEHTGQRRTVLCPRFVCEVFDRENPLGVVRWAYMQFITRSAPGIPLQVVKDFEVFCGTFLEGAARTASSMVKDCFEVSKRQPFGVTSFNRASSSQSQSAMGQKTSFLDDKF
jgi:hypothetical protein